jgi:retron-type reverse transcriptase
MPPRSFFVDPSNREHLAVARNFSQDSQALAFEFIQKRNLPYIVGDTELAAYIGISPALIRQICHNKKFHYRIFQIPRKNGPDRVVHAPRTYLKVIQWWILDNILSRVEVHPAAFGFVRDRDYVENARFHVGSRHVLNVDIERFFPNINLEMISGVFESLGYSHEASAFLADLSSIDDQAPTGAPTSPMLGNLVLRELDAELHNFATENDFKYSRYADDITISSGSFIDEEVLAFVSAAVARYGFNLNLDKTKFMGKGDRMEVTGLTINEKVNASKDWRNSARGFLNRVRHNPREFVERFDVVAGVYGTLCSIDPDHETKLTVLARRALDALKECEAPAD